MPDDEQHTLQVWQRQPDEPNKWYARFLLYMQLGTNRTLMRVLHDEEARNGKTKQSVSPPRSWFDLYHTWQWKSRAEAYDEEQRRLEAQRKAEEQALYEQQRKHILESGFALMHERVKTLDALTRKLQAYTDDENNIWLTGAKGETVFNDGLFREIRAHLDDIAKELGERVKLSKQELTGKDGGALEVENKINVHVFYPQQEPNPEFEEMDEEEGKG